MTAPTGTQDVSEAAEPLPQSVFASAQVREFDRIAIIEIGIPGYELMQRAGRAALSAIHRHFPDTDALTVYCGAGNNGGDGYVVARLAVAAGLDVRVRIAIVRDAAALDAPAGVVVDALLGTGLTRGVEGLFAAAVAAINASGRPVVALDVPSGLDSDTGHVHGVAINAALTVTFVGLKQGLYLGQAPDHTGPIEFAGLGIPAPVRERAVPMLLRLAPETLVQELPKRSRMSHKVMNGRVLLVGGAPGMAGAIRLAAEAALRAGAGLVHVATHPISVAAVMAGRPEMMCRGVETAADLAAWLDDADAIVLGPGLGQSPWGQQLFDAVVTAPVPLVLDADGLNLLARRRLERGDWLLTPHPGEAARLLETTSESVQADRLAAVTALAVRYGADVILKGACSLVAEARAAGRPACFVCDRGNAGMATAGMGDVLAGLAGGLAAQRRGVAGVGRIATLVHALAGDDAARSGERGTIASDLLGHIRTRVNPQ
jgi:NAD(P)H-hydrate epimerase